MKSAVKRFDTSTEGAPVEQDQMQARSLVTRYDEAVTEYRKAAEESDSGVAEGRDYEDYEDALLGIVHDLAELVRDTFSLGRPTE